MGKHFTVNGDLCIDDNPNAAMNGFIGAKAEDTPLPVFSEIRGMLPEPVWEGHDDEIRCYYRAWEIAFGNLRKPVPEAGFVSNFIDTAFNGYLFMWDSSFIMMFAKYAGHIFNFQGTLDNFYSNQYRDGFICREICESEPGGQFAKDDPASTGPNVLPWAEWEYYKLTHDKERLSKVFRPLLAYHEWTREHRSWKDGSYWSCGLASGMDNQPRQKGGYNPALSHGFMSWIDATCQAYLSANLLCKMAHELGLDDDISVLSLKEEAKMLKKTVNNKMWSEEDAFYYDTNRDGKLSGVKTVGAYWAMLSDILPKKRADRFVAHLNNENEFNTPVRVPSLSKDNPNYNPDGAYWCGGVWAPTNYMVLRGLSEYGYEREAYEIACNYVDAVTDTFVKYGSIYENYSPEKHAPGIPAKDEFVGWSGIPPIAVLIEYVLGIRADSVHNKIIWHINRLEKHGIKGYRFGDKTVDLICEARNSSDEEPVVHINGDVKVEIIFRPSK